MEKLVKEYADYLCSDLPASTKFWEIEKRIKRDRKTLGVCIELTKSDMFWDIAGLINDKVISMDDLEEFSDDLKEAVALILRRWKYCCSWYEQESGYADKSKKIGF